MLRRISLALLPIPMIAACNDPGPGDGGDGLSADPTALDFGEVVIGLLARRALILENRTPDVVRVIEVRRDDPIADSIRLERVPAALVAGSSAEIEVVFAPTVEGVFSGSIRIRTDGDPAELSVEISGVAVSPFLRAIPEQIDFGRVLLSHTAVWTATITNAGSKAVTVDAITPDMFSDEFSVGTYAIEELDPGESFSVDIMFTPEAGGRATGRIVIGDDSPRPVPLTIAVTGEGIDGEIALEPMTIDFTGALVGEERVRSFEIRNIGTATHTIDSIAIAQSDPPAFFDATSGIALPFTLPPGDERRIWIAFRALDDQSHSGTVAVSGADVLAHASLFGVAFAGPASRLEVRPRAIDFGGVEIGSSGTREVEIKSQGFVMVDAIEIDPPDAPFLLVGAPPVGTTLYDLDSHTLEVVYRPEAVASHTAVLRVPSDATHAPNALIAEIPLFGRGEASPSSDADPRPTSLEFGWVPRDVERLRTIILFNGGTAPLSITGVGIPNSAGERFQLERAPGPLPISPIAPGEHQAIRIRYADPLGLSAVESGTVAIATDDPDRPLVLVPLLAATIAPSLEHDIRVRTSALDLHFMGSTGALFDRPTDVCWCNPNPDWGDAAGSPSLDNDFTGPQTVSLTTADGIYLVDVHSRESTPMIAEVTVEMAGSPPVVRTREVGPGQRWRVGTIEFRGLERTFTTATLPLDMPMDDSCY